MAKGKSLSISELSSAVSDNGRRGEPRSGCDCMQCFGYCIINADEAFRLQSERQSRYRTARPEGEPLDLEAV
jgi:hypothetical protein